MDNKAYSNDVDRYVKEQTDTAERQWTSPSESQVSARKSDGQKCDVYWRTNWPVQLITAHQTDIDVCLLVRNLTGCSIYPRPYFIAST